MVKSGMVLYNSKLDKVIIQSSDERFIKATVERISIVSFNNDTQQEVQKFSDKETIPIKHIGIYLFFKKEDIKEDYKTLVKKSKYVFNKEEIVTYHIEKKRKLIESIKADAPERPITTKEMNQIISNYFDINCQQKEEESFRRLTKGKVNYFGRMDFSTHYYKSKHEKLFSGDYYERIYLSKDGTLERKDIKVIDWRTPIGDFYYNNETTEFTYGDTYEYKLLLKRSFQQSPFKFHNLYLEGMNLYAEGSVDEFLIKLLHEKRSLHKPTDIIQSIQSNQNKIIRANPKKNMIVQGCAGSGKTMILLHRLSYLLYNEHIANTENVTIITPSERFNVFYSDLSSYLDLENVASSTFKVFYQMLIHQYSAEFFIKEQKKVTAIKKEINDKISKTTTSTFAATSTLSYEDDSIRNIRKVYDDVIKDIISVESLDVVTRITRRFNIKQNDYSKLSNNEKMKLLNSLCSKTIPYQNEEKHKQCISLDDKHSKEKQQLKNIQEQMYSCDLFADVVRKKVEYDRISQLDKDIIECNKIIKSNSEIASEIYKLKTTLESTEETYRKSLNKQTNIIGGFEKQIAEFDSKLSNLTIINIFKRNAIQREKKITLNELNKSKESMEAIKANKNNQMTNLYDLISKLIKSKEFVIREKSLEGVRALAEDIENSTIFNQQKLDHINTNNKLLEIFFNNELYSSFVEPLYSLTTDFVNSINRNNDGTIDTNVNVVMRITGEIISSRLSLKGYLSLIDQLFIELNEININLKSKYLKSEENVKTLNNNLIEEKAKLLTNEEASLLEKFDKQTSINHNLVGYIKASLLKNTDIAEEIVEKDLTNRYECFMELLLLFLHYGSLRNPKKAIFIDEGQNYSINDYRVIQRVTGKNTILNIFGDTNQLVNNSIGNSSWDKLKKEFAASYYELNENYRNTVQITKYCNKTFKYKHNAIGVDGEKVTNIKREEIVETINLVLLSYASERIAYITKENIGAEIVEKNIFFGSVADATGLEFDVVIFDPTKCNKNEKYIGMTRSLEKLYIVK